jgi:hypothetical protein
MCAPFFERSRASQPSVQEDTSSSMDIEASTLATMVVQQVHRVLIQRSFDHFVHQTIHPISSRRANPAGRRRTIGRENDREGIA